MRRTVLLASCFCLLLTACFESHRRPIPGAESPDAGLDAEVRPPPDRPPPDRPPPDGGLPVPEEERFLRDYERALCECVVRYEHSERMWHVADSTCHPGLSVEWVLAARELLAAGEIRFDPAAAEACRAELAGLDCTEGLWTTEPASDSACRDVFVGLLPVGADCWSPFPPQCEPDAFCNGDPGEGHVCTPRAAPGEECWRGECTTYGEGGGCVDRVCRGLAGEGAPCTETHECRAELYCIDGSCMPAYEGMPCSGTCGRSFACVGGACIRGLPEGEACTLDTRCEPQTVCEGEPRVCTSTVGDDVGDLCWRNEWSGADTCSGELACQLESADRRAAGRCVRGQPAGASCSLSSPCLSGHVCAEGRCRPVVGPGAACGPDVVCPLGFVCADGSCEPLPLPGERCDARYGCFQGTCVDGTCCLRRPGDACSGVDYPLGECSGGCDDGTCWEASCADRCAPGTTCWERGYDCAPQCPALEM